MSLEATASALPEMRIPGLDYSLGATASFVLARRFTSQYPEGGQVYNPATGQRQLRFKLTDASGGFLDLSTVRWAFDLTNLHATRDLQLTGQSLMCLCERVRIILGGQVIEDSLLHYRLVAMLMKTLPPARNWSSSMENLGPATEAAGFSNGPVQDPIAANSSRHLLTPFHGSGFFASHYLIPLEHVPVHD